MNIYPYLISSDNSSNHEVLTSSEAFSAALRGLDRLGERVAIRVPILYLNAPESLDFERIGSRVAAADQEYQRFLQRLGLHLD